MGKNIINIAVKFRIYIQHCLLKDRKPASQAGNGMAEFSSVTKEKQKFLCKTNVRFADLKALETPYKYRRPHAEQVSDVDEESSPCKGYKYNKGATVGQPIMVVAG